jgi:hypothetical protein
MRTRKVGSKTVMTFTYLEWVAAGKALPKPEFEVEGKIEYIITEVPEDKRDFFESLGLKAVRLAINKAKGLRRIAGF